MIKQYTAGSFLKEKNINKATNLSLKKKDIQKISEKDNKEGRDYKIRDFNSPVKNTETKLCLNENTNNGINYFDLKVISLEDDNIFSKKITPINQKSKPMNITNQSFLSKTHHESKNNETINKINPIIIDEETPCSATSDKKKKKNENNLNFGELLYNNFDYISK